MRTDRITRRHALKEKLKYLETIIRVHQPLMKAQQVTQEAFQKGREQGFREGLEAAELAATKAADEATAKAVEESNAKIVAENIRRAEEIGL